jgi:hypothetical protein
MTGAEAAPRPRRGRSARWVVHAAEEQQRARRPFVDREQERPVEPQLRRHRCHAHRHRCRCGGFGPEFVDVDERLVLHARNVQVVYLGDAHETRAWQERDAHAEAIQRVVQPGAVVEPELRHGQHYAVRLELGQQARPARRRELRHELVQAAAVGRREQHHGERTVRIRQLDHLHGTVAQERNVRIHAHERYRRRAAIAARERARLRRRRLERSRPRSPEVHRIDQEHAVQRVDGFDEVLDAAARRVLRPPADGPWRGRAGEVEGRDLGREVLSHRVEERLLHGKTLAIPDGVREAELDLGVPCPQLRDEAAVGGIDLRLAHVAEPERGAHGVECLTDGAVQRHAEGHGHAERRDQQVLLLRGFRQFPEQAEAERRAGAGHLLFHGRERADRLLRLRAGHVLLGAAGGQCGGRERGGRRGGHEGAVPLSHAAQPVQFVVRSPLMTRGVEGFCRGCGATSRPCTTTPDRWEFEQA